MNVVTGFVTLLAQNGWGDHMDWDGGWWVAMMIGMVIFWALVALGIVWLVREMSGHRGGGDRGDDPLALLDRRLAEGTISPEDYRERRAILTGSSRSGDSAEDR